MRRYNIVKVRNLKERLKECLPQGHDLLRQHIQYLNRVKAAHFHPDIGHFGRSYSSDSPLTGG